MLIVATFGIFFNGVLIYVLHGPGFLDGSHSHSHGGGHGHSHGFGSSHSHSHNDNSHSHSHDHEPAHNDIMTGSGEKSHLVESQSHMSHDSDVEDKPNINVHAALMHVICDLIQSVGVFLTAIIIKIWPSWTIMDPILTLMFSVIVVITTKNTFIGIMSTLMEGVPDGVDIGAIQDELQKGLKSRCNKRCNYLIFFAVSRNLLFSFKIEGVQDVHAMLGLFQNFKSEKKFQKRIEYILHLCIFDKISSYFVKQPGLCTSGLSPPTNTIFRAIFFWIQHLNKVNVPPQSPTPVNQCYKISSNFSRLQFKWRLVHIK